MKLRDLARKAAALPDDADFHFGGPEQWAGAVFDREVRTLEDAIEYINALRARMADYAIALDRLSRAYRKMRDVMLEAEVGE